MLCNTSSRGTSQGVLFSSLLHWYSKKQGRVAPWGAFTCVPVVLVVVVVGGEEGGHFNYSSSESDSN